jgi:hypothetical protein
MATDYSKQTVAQLKKLATDRGISAALKSGLRKADIIEKIEEFDAAMSTQEASALEPAPGTDEQPSVEDPLAPEPTAEDPLPATIQVPSSTVEDAGLVLDTTQPSSDFNTPVPTEEIIEDSRKRKRRSVTPPIHAAEIAAKRQKQEENLDTDVAVSDVPPQVTEPIEVEEQAGNSFPNIEAQEVQNEPLKEEEAPIAPSPKISSGTDNKWSRETLFDKKPNVGEARATTEDDDKATEPAMHHATSALYIRNLERPVKLPDLERDLVSYASPPSAERDSDVIKTIHLDQVKTHALVLFSSVSAASRARSSLHGRKWPPGEEKWRHKTLWVDFIPDEKVAEWIENEEKNNLGKTGGRRWEVVYIENDHGVIEAIHREEGSNTSLAPRQPSGQSMSTKDSTGPPPNAPLGPRSSTRQDRPSVSARPIGPTPGTIPTSQDKTFETLDELFRFTVAKPKLYWKTVSDELVEKRKDEFKHETSRDWTPAKWTDRDEEKRYTFEDGDRLVHSGAHNTSSRVRRREEDIRRGILPGPSNASASVSGGRGGGGRGGSRYDGGRDYRGSR